MDQVFTPRHTPHRQFELQWHASCGHMTWRRRTEAVPEGMVPALAKYLPMGLPLCSTCQAAQEKPDPAMALLVGSVALKRITAVGFGVGRKEELKALKFVWKPAEHLWIFPVPPQAMEEHLRHLSASLGCASEALLSLKIPPVPASSANVASNPDPKMAVIACPVDKRPIQLAPGAQGRLVMLGTIPWPPDLTALPDVSDFGLPPNVPRRLVLSPVDALARSGFTREDLWRLIDAAADLGVTVGLAGHEINTKHLQDVLLQLPRRRPVDPHVDSGRPPTKGGRPRTAALHQEEIVRRYAQGQSMAAIARALGFSARSVGRMIRMASTLSRKDSC